jgi:branched-chain amino acid transport system substrate-binding protein
LPSTTQGASDFSEILDGVRAKSSEVLFFGGLSYEAGPMIAQMKRLGIPARFMGADGVCQDNLMSRWAAISVTEGEVICASPGSGLAVSDAAATFRAAYQERFGSQAQYYEAQAYDAVMVMVDAMARAGSPEPAKVLSHLARTDGYKGITGSIAFDARGDLRQAPLSIHTYKGQEKSAVGIAH